MSILLESDKELADLLHLCGDEEYLVRQASNQIGGLVPVMGIHSFLVEVNFFRD